MDDLSGLEWSAKATSAQGTRPNYNLQAAPLQWPAQPKSVSPLPTLSRPQSSLSGRVPQSTSPLKPSTPANDSFANLLSSSNGPKAPTAVLTLQERQRQLEQERQQKSRAQQAQQVQETQLWDKLGTSKNGSRTTLSGRNTPAVAREDTDDILAAFNSSAKVDSSSHFPPPPPPTDRVGSGRNTPAVTSPKLELDDEDDPFGLGAMPAPLARSYTPRRESRQSEDDILGDLGRPVQKTDKKEVRSPLMEEGGQDYGFVDDSHDRAIAELVNMGFELDRAKYALQQTNGDIQGAVSFLINAAHAESGKQSRSRQTPAAPNSGKQVSQDLLPAPAKTESRSTSRQRQSDSTPPSNDRSSANSKPASSGKPLPHTASEASASFFKSANSLWNAGRKQVQKAVADFQQDGPTNQPRWMRDASADSGKSETWLETTRRPPPATQQNVTDEALMLESDSGKPQRQQKPISRLTHESAAPSPLRGRSPAQVLPERSIAQQNLPFQAAATPRYPTKLSREQVEQEAAQAYVSSARRRKPQAPSPASQPEVDLFSSQSHPAAPQASAASGRTKPSASVSGPTNGSSTNGTRPAPEARARVLPSVSPAVLRQSAQHRAKGGEAFKRGDFDAAHQAYTAALTSLPHNHPVVIVVLSNRALTAIKTGDPKAAVIDVDRLLAIIGPSRGEGETIMLGDGSDGGSGGEGNKDMREFYGKGLARKAEALEAMEKWSDALIVWKNAIAAGSGGLTAIRGRERCAKAISNPDAGSASRSAGAGAAPSKSTVSTNRARPTPATPATRTGLSSVSNKSFENDAVRKLRNQHAAAEKLDDEKFALADAVSGRVDGWRGGKGDNLRALLSSLENVLWEGSGWKKVGMAELVLPNKVKIVYMKAIAKVHPDKIPQHATTEQRMISGSVFSTLNEAWDKFRTDNGL